MAKKCVEIELDTETGEFTVAECPPKEEAMPGEESGEPAGQSFQSPEEALKAAMQILTEDGSTPEEQAQAGYDKGAKPASTRPAVGEVFGEGM